MLLTLAKNVFTQKQTQNSEEDRMLCGVPMVQKSSKITELKLIKSKRKFGILKGQCYEIFDFYFWLNTFLLGPCIYEQDFNSVCDLFRRRKVIRLHLHGHTFVKQHKIKLILLDLIVF